MAGSKLAMGPSNPDSWTESNSFLLRSTGTPTAVTQGTDMCSPVRRNPVLRRSILRGGAHPNVSQRWRLPQQPPPSTTLRGEPVRPPRHGNR